MRERKKNKHTHYHNPKPNRFVKFTRSRIDGSLFEAVSDTGRAVLRCRVLEVGPGNERFYSVGDLIDVRWSHFLNGVDR